MIIVRGAFRLARQPVWLERGEEGGGLGWRGSRAWRMGLGQKGAAGAKGAQRERKGASEAELARPGLGRGWGSSASHGVSDECQMFH